MQVAPRIHPVFRVAVATHLYEQILQFPDVDYTNDEPLVVLPLLCLQQEHLRAIGRFLLLHSELVRDNIDRVKCRYVEIGQKIIHVKTRIIYEFLYTPLYVFDINILHEMALHLAQIADIACTTGNIQQLLQSFVTIVRLDFLGEPTIQPALSYILHKSSVLAYSQNKHVAGQSLLILEKTHIINNRLHSDMPALLQRIYDTGRDKATIHELFLAITDNETMLQYRTGYHDLYAAACVAYEHTDIPFAVKLLEFMTHTTLAVVCSHDVLRPRLSAAMLALELENGELSQRLLRSMMAIAPRASDALRHLGDASVWAHEQGYFDLAHEVMCAYRDCAISTAHLCIYFYSDIAQRKNSTNNTRLRKLFDVFYIDMQHIQRVQTEKESNAH